MGSGRGLLAGDWHSGEITRTQNVSEYMLVLALYLVFLVILLRDKTRWLVGWSLTSLFSTNTAISEMKGQGWRVILLPSEVRLVIY